MSIRIMSNIWEHSQQSGTDLLMLLAIADCANDDGIAWPSIRTLAKKARLSERQAQRTIRHLEESQELVIHPRFRNTHVFQFPGWKNGKYTLEGVTDVTVKPTAPDLFTGGKEGDTDVTLSDEGDICVTQETRVTSEAGRVTSEAGRVTSMTVEGDTAMSPEPSLTIIKPTVINSTISIGASAPADNCAETTGPEIEDGQSKTGAEIPQSSSGAGANGKTGEDEGKGKRQVHRKRDLLFETLAVICNMVPLQNGTAEKVRAFRAAIMAGQEPPVILEDWDASITTGSCKWLSKQKAQLAKVKASPKDLLLFAAWKGKYTPNPEIVVRDWTRFVNESQKRETGSRPTGVQTDDHERFAKSVMG